MSHEAMKRSRVAEPRYRRHHRTGGGVDDRLEDQEAEKRSDPASRTEQIAQRVPDERCGPEQRFVRDLGRFGNPGAHEPPNAFG